MEKFDQKTVPFLDISCRIHPVTSVASLKMLLMSNYLLYVSSIPQDTRGHPCPAGVIQYCQKKISDRTISIACQVLDRYRRSTIHFKRRKTKSCSDRVRKCRCLGDKMEWFRSKISIVLGLMDQYTWFHRFRISNIGLLHGHPDRVCSRHSFRTTKRHIVGKR